MAPAPADRGSGPSDAKIPYEMAGEILALLCTDSARELRQAQSQDPADAADVHRLESVHAWYTQLRQSLDDRPPEEIDEIIGRYGPLARLVADSAAP